MLLLNSVLCIPSVQAAWFPQQDVLTVAHQKLLEGSSAESFDAMIQAWQGKPTEEQEANLNALLNLAVTEDCGRSLDATRFPAWLKSLTVQREMIQNQSQVLPKLAITGTASKQIKHIDFIRWPQEKVLSASPGRLSGDYFSIETKRLEKASSAGLYQLIINTGDGEEFKEWVILSPPKRKQWINWIDSRTWRIEKNGLPDKACPTPILSMNIYDLNDTSWTPLWTENVDGRLPTSLPEVDLPDGRYWLSVGIIESRWQGELSVLDIQSITRPVDHTGDSFK